MKFKVGDRVVIIGTSCDDSVGCVDCEIFKSVPYMIVHDFYGNKIHLMLPKDVKKGYDGCRGCSGFTEKDIRFYCPSLKQVLDE